MTITGTIKQILPEQSGVSKAGKNWRRRDQILDITMLKDINSKNW